MFDSIGFWFRQSGASVEGSLAWREKICQSWFATSNTVMTQAIRFGAADEAPPGLAPIGRRWVALPSDRWTAGTRLARAFAADAPWPERLRPPTSLNDGNIRDYGSAQASALRQVVGAGAVLSRGSGPLYAPPDRCLADVEAGRSDWVLVDADLLEPFLWSRRLLVPEREAMQHRTQEDAAFVRRIAQQLIVPAADALEQLPLAGPLDRTVLATSHFTRVDPHDRRAPANRAAVARSAGHKVQLGLESTAIPWSTPNCMRRLSLSVSRRGLHRTCGVSLTVGTIATILADLDSESVDAFLTDEVLRLVSRLEDA